MANIFENQMTQDDSALKKAYVRKIIRLFDDRQFAFEFSVNLIQALMSTVPGNENSNRKLLDIIPSFLNDYLDYDNSTLPRLIKIFCLPESTKKEEMIKRLTYLIVQIMFIGYLLNGVKIDIKDVINGPLNNINIVVKASKFAFSQKTNEFIMNIHENYTGNFEDQKSQESAADAMQKLIKTLPDYFNF